jgi:hypothetical protein
MFGHAFFSASLSMSKRRVKKCVGKEKNVWVFAGKVVDFEKKE